MLYAIQVLLREVAAYEDEIFARAHRREEGRARSDAARKVASGGAVDKGAFGNLYPPKEKRQQEMHDAIATYALGAKAGAADPLTLTNLSGEESVLNRYSRIPGTQPQEYEYRIPPG